MSATASGPRPAERSIRSDPVAPVRGSGSVLARLLPSTAAPLTLVGVAAVGAYSVPRYDWRIVVVYVMAAALLGTALWRSQAGVRHRFSRPAAAVALAAAGLLTWAVPGFSYVPEARTDVLRLLVLVAGLLGAGAVLSGWRHGPDVALAAAMAAYTATAAVLIRLDPAPRIDVWYILQGAADGLLHGQNLYAQTWVGPPGPMPAFTYLPWTAVLLAPGRWLLGDVRWTLVVITLCTGLILRALARRPLPGTPDDETTDTSRDQRYRAGAVSGALLLLLPGTATQVEQAWTEPVLLACLAVAVLTGLRGRWVLAILALALALASKQHIVLLLPLLAVWPRFGFRRTLAVGFGAGLLVLPWFLADPAAMWHDTVTLLVDFPPLKFSDTIYIAVLNEWGIRLPFWLTGVTVVATIASVATIVHRRNPGPAEVVRWGAFVLLVANLVNKQAFYNQYWLVATLVLLSWALEPAPAKEASLPRTESTPEATAESSPRG